jgi:predicted nucleic-acid-binding Zn-ribbon protein
MSCVNRVSYVNLPLKLKKVLHHFEEMQDDMYRILEGDYTYYTEESQVALTGEDFVDVVDVLVKRLKRFERCVLQNCSRNNLYLVKIAHSTPGIMEYLEGLNRLWAIYGKDIKADYSKGDIILLCMKRIIVTK